MPTIFELASGGDKGCTKGDPPINLSDVTEEKEVWLRAGEPR